MKTLLAKQRWAKRHQRVMRLQVFFYEQDGLCAVCGKPLKGFTPKIETIDYARAVYKNQCLVHLHCSGKRPIETIDRMVEEKAERMRRWNVRVGPQGAFVGADFKMAF